MALSEVKPPHEYVALSKAGPSQAPLRGACGSMPPVRVPCLLCSHLLYWNSMHDRSKWLFRGLRSNHEYIALSKVGPPQAPFGAPAAPRAQSECIARTFSIGTPCATSPRGCFEGLVRTLICRRGPKLDLPSPSASLASLAPSLLELHV